jgi:hypothetical protein
LGTFWLLLATVAPRCSLLTGWMHCLWRGGCQATTTVPSSSPVASLFLRSSESAQPGQSATAGSGFVVLVLAVLLGHWESWSTSMILVAYATIIWVGVFCWSTSGGNRHFWPPMYLVTCCPARRVLLQTVDVFAGMSRPN